MNNFLNEITDSVVKLSRKKLILFCVLTCEKLLPNYISFEKQNNWGKYEILQDSIDSIYQYLINDQLFIKDDFSELLKKIDTITPHTEDFPGILTSFALDACTSIESTLNFILDNNIEHVIEVVSNAYDTVDMFVQEKEDIDPADKQIEEKIMNDIFMQRERSRQKDLMNRISNLTGDNITDDLINSLKKGQRIIDLTYLE